MRLTSKIITAHKFRERGGEPASTRRCPNVGLMLAHRLRRWTNISPTLGQRLVFAGILDLVWINCIKIILLNWEGHVLQACPLERTWVHFSRFSLLSCRIYWSQCGGRGPTQLITMECACRVSCSPSSLLNVLLQIKGCICHWSGRYTLSNPRERYDYWSYTYNHRNTQILWPINHVYTP